MYIYRYMYICAWASFLHTIGISRVLSQAQAPTRPSLSTATPAFFEALIPQATSHCERYKHIRYPLSMSQLSQAVCPFLSLSLLCLYHCLLCLALSMSLLPSLTLCLACFLSIYLWLPPSFHLFLSLCSSTYTLKCTSVYKHTGMHACIWPDLCTHDARNTHKCRNVSRIFLSRNVVQMLVWPTSTVRQGFSYRLSGSRPLQAEAYCRYAHGYDQLWFALESSGFLDFSGS